MVDIVWVGEMVFVKERDAIPVVEEMEPETEFRAAWMVERDGVGERPNGRGN